MTTSKYELLSSERKALQSRGEAPIWMTTPAYQMLSNKGYLLTNETPKGMYKRLAKRAAELTPNTVNVKDFCSPTEDFENWYEAYFSDMWNGYLSPATSVLSNMGTDRGHCVACSGGVMEDSIKGFYEARKELALLTQLGYGTSISLDEVRPRGSKISKGGTANGVSQPMLGIVQDMKDISQGTRRGSCGQYLNILHPDFNEVCDQLIADDDGLNIGWNIGDDFIDLLRTNPKRADKAWKRMLKVKGVKGKGYNFYIDKANRAQPKVVKDMGMKVHGSNLCSEVNLPSDDMHTFSCVLSSINVARYDSWKDTMVIERSAVFMDTLITDTEEKIYKDGLEDDLHKLLRFMQGFRAIGMGTLGQSTYYQTQLWEFGGIESQAFNMKIAKMMNSKTLWASRYLAKYVGEPEYLIGHGERFSHRLMNPPTMSTGVIQGNPSAGIEPVFSNVYVHDTAAGSIYMITPAFFELLKSKGIYSEELMSRIAEDGGSIQKCVEFTDREKNVFRTAFEVNQEVILQMASARQTEIDQGQSVNLYFGKNADENYISKLHFIALMDDNLLGLYYMRTTNADILQNIECVSCSG